MAESGRRMNLGAGGIRRLGAWIWGISKREEEMKNGEGRKEPDVWERALDELY
jgi:hypothetical protein